MVFAIGNAMSKKNEALPQGKQENDKQLEKTTADIDKEVYMPKKLIFSTLPDDYPKELDDLFRFYYDTMYKIAAYDHELASKYEDPFYNNKTAEYLDSLPISKILHLRYLIWLARNTIPKYFAEYTKINSGREVGNIPIERIKRSSIIPEKFWTGLFFKNQLAVFPKVGVLNAKIRKRIKEEYPDKLHFLNTSSLTAQFVYLKGRIIKKKYVEASPDSSRIKTWPYYYVKIKVLDAIGGEFKQKEIIVRIGLYSFQSWTKSLVPIEVGKEYFMPIVSLAEPNIIKGKVIFDGKLINNSLIYTASITGLYPLTNDKYKSRSSLYGGLNLFSLGKKEVKYEEIKKAIENDIKFLKSAEKNRGVK